MRSAAFSQSTLICICGADEDAEHTPDYPLAEANMWGGRKCSTYWSERSEDHSGPPSNPRTRNLRPMPEDRGPYVRQLIYG